MRAGIDSARQQAIPKWATAAIHFEDEASAEMGLKPTFEIQLDRMRLTS